MTDLAPDRREVPSEPSSAPPLPTPPRMTTARAIVEVLLCSSYPTQLVVAGALAAGGVPGLTADGALNGPFVIAVSLGDAALVVGLAVWFIRRNGESMAEVFIAGRRPWREAWLGVALTPLVLVGVSLLVAAVRVAAPTLHNVPTNPMSALMRDPMLVATFAFVVVVAGGVREELQRGFQLHRLTGHVCGPWPALALTSVTFGVGHTLQGYDVAIATAALGAFWGWLYLGRHSIIAAAVSHGLFNLSQVAIAWKIGDQLTSG